MSGINLVHSGGPISMEHLESMSQMALAVQVVVKGHGAKRHASQSKDRKPYDDWKRGNAHRHSAPTPDPKCMSKRFNIDDYSDFYGEPVVFETEITWHSQFVRPTVIGMVGSKNTKKRQRSWGRAEAMEAKRRRKAQRRHRPTNHELQLVALRSDFGGEYPFRVTVPQSAPKALDMALHQAMTCPKERHVPVPQAQGDYYSREQDLNYRLKEQPTIVLDRTIRPIELVQRPEPEVKAKPNRTALVAENEDRYFSNARRFVLANSRGI